MARKRSNKTVAKKVIKKASKTTGGVIVLSLCVVALIVLAVVAFTVPMPFLNNQTIYYSFS